MPRHVFCATGHRHKPKTVIRQLCANELSFWHLSSRFSVTMEPHCALKTRTHLLKNRSCYHHNANDRFGFIIPCHLAIFQHHARTREMPVEGFAMRLPARLKDVNEEASLSSIQHPVALFILSHFDILLFFAAIAILQLHLDHGHIARRIHIGREHFP